MGQQQLLLLVLGIVIVGIAVVAGINAYVEGKTKADRDAAYSEAMRLVSQVQAWKLLPAAVGGGAAQASFATVTFPALGITPNNGVRYQTETGCYQLRSGTNAQIRVFTRNCGTRIATITIPGRRPANLRWVYN